jgi:thiol-disulfide isomerase/thioredoxin
MTNMTNLAEKKSPLFLIFMVLPMLIGAGQVQAGPTVQQALELQPVQPGVDFDEPLPAEAKSCKLETAENTSGWVLYDPNGRPLRRFLDSDGNKKLDRWCYYRGGIEVYRDIDTDKNGRADQYRWLGTAGTKWGLDRDEDGVIESWKRISPEEVSAEVVEAFRHQDLERFEALLMRASEIQALGLGVENEKRLTDLTQKAVREFKNLKSGDLWVKSNSQWVSFSATRPGVVPAGNQGSTKDLVVYENAVTMFQTDGKHQQLLLGTLIQLGDTWRMVDLPVALKDNETTAPGFFFSNPLVQQSELQNLAEGNPQVDRKLMDELEEIDEKLAVSTIAQTAELNVRRAEILENIIEHTEDQLQKENWIRQQADTISAAAQAGDFAEGVGRLQALVKNLEAGAENPNLVSYVKFRQLTTEYTLNLQKPDADFPEVQEKWLQDLAAFIGEYPHSEDATEAMLQLAIAEEFAGEEEKAKNWYQKIVNNSPDSTIAAKATGAKRRLDSVGQSIHLNGKTLEGDSLRLSNYRGKVIALHYWATWCGPCLKDMKELKRLQAKFGGEGFTPLGVNLDGDKKTATNFLKQNRHPWPQLYEPGGLDSRLANEFGVLTLPTMLLVDQGGKVLNRSLHVSELEDELEKILR